jgi:hypothetical protein
VTRILVRNLFLLSVLLVPFQGAAQEPGPALGSSAQDPAPAAEAPEPPSWRFRRRDKPVKVIVLAGSIGAGRRHSYAVQLRRMCENVEVKNLSKTGLGAWGLKKRFKRQVLENRRIWFSDPDREYWLVFGGGLNSVAMPESTNWQVRQLTRLAHRRGIKVVALSVTPWGDESDKRRWAGTAGLRYRRATQKVVDFVMGRLSPREALGAYAGRRAEGADAPWSPEELPDVAVDLYDSMLRDASAEPRDLQAMRDALASDRRWQRAHARLTEDERARALEEDARLAAEIPRFYLRGELRSFDHIHLNEEGHRLIAEIACPTLPHSWGCSCPSAAGHAEPGSGGS